MNLEEYSYEPNEIDSETFLSEMPISLMKENIKVQFEDPLENRKKDHITTFLTRYNYSRDNEDVLDDEESGKLTEMRDDFYSFMQQMFRDYLNIGFVDFDDLSEEDQDELIHYTYRFFIMNIKKNFVCLILNFIDNKREDYEEVVSAGVDFKDITAISFKKEIDDPVDIFILSKLSMIIKDILESDISVDEFFDACDIDDKVLETEFVQDKFDRMIITGNFVNQYIDMLDSDFISEIETKVRNKILKKYNKK